MYWKRVVSWTFILFIHIIYIITFIWTLLVKRKLEGKPTKRKLKKYLLFPELLPYTNIISGPATKSVRLRCSFVWMSRGFRFALEIFKTTCCSTVTKKTFCSTTRRIHLQASYFFISSADVSRSEIQHYMSSAPKRTRSDNMTVKKIGTHNGTFHCDEVLACFFLRQLPEYAVSTKI